MTAFKAQAHMRELKQRLSLLMKSAVMSEAQDASGFPQLKVVNAGETILMSIIVDGNAGRVDGLGLPQRVYSPHIAQMLRADAAADEATRAIILAAMAKLGMKLEIYQKAALPASFDLTGATMVSSIPSDEINPLTISQ